MQKSYKIVARTTGWIASRDVHFNGKNEVVVCERLTLKDARDKLLKLFCDDYEVYFPNWGVAMNSKLGRDYANRRSDDTYSYECDSRYYSIEEEEVLC